MHCGWLLYCCYLFIIIVSSNFSQGMAKVVTALRDFIRYNPSLKEVLTKS
jgi:hypothetical protein